MMDSRLAAAVFAAVLGALSSTTSAPAMAQVVRVGSIGGATGAIATMNVAVLQSRALAIADVNAQGGIDESRVALVLADTGCTADGAATEAARLSSEAGVRVFVGPNCSVEVEAALDAAPGALFISDTATASALSRLEDGDRFFRTTPADDRQAAAIARLIRAEGGETVVVSHARDAYSAGLAKAFAKAFPAVGGRIAATQAHAAGRGDYAGDVAALEGLRADALVLFASRGETGLAYLSAAVGAFRRIYGPDAMADEEVLAALGPEKLAGVAFTAPKPALGTAAFARFADIAREGDVDPEAPFVAQAYDAAFLAALTLEAARTTGATLPAALRAVSGAPGIKVLPGQWAEARAALAAGEAVNYEGASGPMDFDRAGDVAGRYAAYRVGADGSWTATPLR